MDKDFANYVIDKAKYGNLAVLDEDNTPYIIPLSIVRKDDKLYFHSAKEGRKVDLFSKHDMVTISFVGDVEVPNLYDDIELDEIVKNKENMRILISSVFTTEFESAIVKGQIELVEDEIEKKNAMELICKKYTNNKMKYFDNAIEAGLKRTSVYRVNILDISSKRKKYDNNKEEMKWQRMI